MKMKKQMLWSTIVSMAVILSVATIFAPSAYAAYVAENTDKQSECQNADISPDSDYTQWGIEIKEVFSDYNGMQIGETAYYYKNERIRIFMDTRADGSFEKFFVDDKGTVDICFVRNSNGLITLMEPIDKKTADTILSEFDTLSRLSKDELSNNVLSALNDCTGSDWYLIKGTGTNYIYYNGLQYNFSYQFNPDKTIVNIIDFGKESGNYVLLAIPDELQLTFTYDSKPIIFTQVVIK